MTTLRGRKKLLERCMFSQKAGFKNIKIRWKGKTKQTLFSFLPRNDNFCMTLHRVCSHNCCAKRIMYTRSPRLKPLRTEDADLMIGPRRASRERGTAAVPAMQANTKSRTPQCNFRVPTRHDQLCRSIDQRGDPQHRGMTQGHTAVRATPSAIK